MIILQGFYDVFKQLESPDRFLVIPTQAESPDLYIVIPTIVLAAATMALVGITTYYAYQTRNLVNVTREQTREAREQAKIPFIPYISASWMGTFEYQRDETTQYIKLRITNVGVGTATNVIVHYSIPTLDMTERTTSYVSMLPGSSGELSIGAAQPQRGQQVQVHLRYEYDDILDRRHDRNQQVTISHDLLPQ